LDASAKSLSVRSGDITKTDESARFLRCDASRFIVRETPSTWFHTVLKMTTRRSGPYPFRALPFPTPSPYSVGMWFFFCCTAEEAELAPGADGGGVFSAAGSAPAR
jgi:hypothetical protein